MKNQIARILLFSHVALCAGCVSGPAHDVRQPAGVQTFASPRLYLKPSPVFDSECSQRSGFKVDPNWYTELFARLPEFQKDWDDNAALLINTSQQLVGKSFSRTEYTVSLTICKWNPMAYPFIISLRPFLKASAEADPQIKNALSREEFVSLTHHELLHNLIDDIVLSPDFSSAMLLKYKAENPNVLVHLHLIAVQQAGYKKLGRADLLRKTEQLYKYIGGDYQRAWQIIGAEGADSFLTELHTFTGQRHEQASALQSPRCLWSAN